MGRYHFQQHSDKDPQHCPTPSRLLQPFPHSGLICFVTGCYSHLFHSLCTANTRSISSLTEATAAWKGGVSLKASSRNKMFTVSQNPSKSQGYTTLLLLKSLTCNQARVCASHLLQPNGFPSSPFLSSLLLLPPLSSSFPSSSSSSYFTSDFSLYYISPVWISPWYLCGS